MHPVPAQPSPCSGAIIGGIVPISKCRQHAAGLRRVRAPQAPADLLVGLERAAVTAGHTARSRGLPFTRIVSWMIRVVVPARCTRHGRWRVVGPFGLVAAPRMFIRRRRGHTPTIPNVRSSSNMEIRMCGARSAAGSRIRNHTSGRISTVRRPGRGRRTNAGGNSSGHGPSPGRPGHRRADGAVQLLIRPRCLAGERERPVLLRLVDAPFTAISVCPSHPPSCQPVLGTRSRDLHHHRVILPWVNDPRVDLPRWGLFQ